MLLQDISNNGSEMELHSSLQLTTNLGLPLAGPVPLPDSAYDNVLMKQYQRYSGDFNQPIHNMHFKVFIIYLIIDRNRYIMYMYIAL